MKEMLRAFLPLSNSKLFFYPNLFDKKRYVSSYMGHLWEDTKESNKLLLTIAGKKTLRAAAT